jgi:hypothetical protein
MIALIAAAVAAATPVNAVETLERMYQQSCSVKAYGSYDDICNGLRKQLKEAQKQQKKDLARQQAVAREQPAAQQKTAAPALSLAPAKD